MKKFLMIIGLCSFLFSSNLEVRFTDGTVKQLDDSYLKEYENAMFKAYTKEINKNEKSVESVSGYVNQNIATIVETQLKDEVYQIDGMSDGLHSNQNFYFFIKDLKNSTVVLYNSNMLNAKIKNNKELEGVCEINFDNARKMIRLMTYHGRGGFLTMGEKITKKHIVDTLEILIPKTELEKIYNK